MLSLSTGCANTAVAVHELGHVVGFWHEQTRPDRDSYITVLWENIREDSHKNFYKRRKEEIDTRGRLYDYNSTMHYSPVSN